MAFAGRDDLFERGLFYLEVEAAHEVFDGFGTHSAREVFLEPVDQVAPHALIVDELLRLHALQRRPHQIEVIDFFLTTRPNFFELFVASLFGALKLDLLTVATLDLNDFFEVDLVAFAQPQFNLLADLVDLSTDVGFEFGLVVMKLVVVDPRHDVRGEVDDLFKLLRRNVEEVTESTRHTLEIPDVRNGRGELDVAHAFATNLGTRNFDTTALTNDALKAHALVLAAVALPVLGRTENLLTEQAVFFRLQRSVVDRLGLFDLTVRPGTNLVGGCKADAQFVA